MAKYEIKHTCGCVETLQLFGPSDKRQWIIEQEQSKPCFECYKKEQFEKAKKEADSNDLPLLIGTEKQTKWAEQIRWSFIKDVEKCIVAFSDKNSGSYYYEKLMLKEYDFENETIMAESLDNILKNTSASFWINTRDDSNLDLLFKHKTNLVKEKEEKTKLVQDVKDESTIYPQNSVTNSRVEIKVKKEDEEKGTVQLFFEKNEDFINLVKSLNYSWDSNEKCWKRKINKFSGTLNDRIIEVSYNLLKKGFPIILFENHLKEKVIKGDYEKEITRWVKYLEGKDKFCINWSNDSENYYNQARKLTGSEWDRPDILIKSDHWEEIIDFCNQYDFKLSSGSLEIIEKKKQLKLEKLMEVKGKKEVSVEKNNISVVDEFLDK